MKTIVRYQAGVLALGTAFAWGNFMVEWTKWSREGALVGCSGAPVANPFLSACFYGALFFTVAFILNIGMLRKL